MKNHRRSTLIIALALIIALMPLQAPASAATGLKTFKQKPMALKPYRTKDFKLVKNKNFGKKDAEPFIIYDQGETTPHRLTKQKGNRKVKVSTWTYLPKTYELSGDMGNPQSVNVTPNGRYAYVTYPKLGSETIGRIVRYDLKKLEALGVTESGKMDDLRYIVRLVGSGYEPTGREKKIFDCMKVGPWIHFGHGAAMAYNPKDKHLWFTTKTNTNKTDLVRVNMKTFKPDYRIKYKMFSNVGIGNNMTFDKNGRLYFFCYSGKLPYAPQGTIKIYQGKIDINNKTKKVSFKLTMSGIVHAASTGIQSAGYNPKRNRIYLVSNSAIVSVPVAKLGKLKASDVWITIFKENREFEGLSYDKNGNGYLLVNKQPELMRITGM